MRKSLTSRERLVSCSALYRSPRCTAASSSDRFFVTFAIRRTPTFLIQTYAHDFSHFMRINLFACPGLVSKHRATRYGAFGGSSAYKIKADLDGHPSLHENARLVVVDPTLTSITIVRA